MAVVQIMQDKLHANLGDLFKSLPIRIHKNPHFRPALLSSALIKQNVPVVYGWAQKWNLAPLYSPISGLGAFLSIPFCSES